jgi:site-specific DNA-methyltransferase (adenine-specific)
MTATKRHPKMPTCSALSLSLRQACNGHPYAKIPWPHRLLHEAADEIERLQNRHQRNSHRESAPTLCSFSASRGSASPANFSSETCEWATPQDFYDRLHKEYDFTLDVCATTENAKCQRYYTKVDDALRQPWAPERCWMNPPYGRDMGKWVQKAWLESQKGALVVCLVPARTDVRWWHDWAMRGEIRYHKGRLRFCRADGARLAHKGKAVMEGRKPAQNTAPFATATVIFHPQNEKGEPR